MLQLVILLSLALINTETYASETSSTRAEIIINANSGTKSGLIFSARMRAYERLFYTERSIDSTFGTKNTRYRDEFVRKAIKEIDESIDGRKWTDTDISKAMGLAASGAGMGALLPGPVQLPLGAVAAVLSAENAAAPYFYDSDPLNPFASGSDEPSSKVVREMEFYKKQAPEIYNALREGFEHDFGVDPENIPENHIAVQVSDIKDEVSDAKQTIREHSRTIGQIEALAKNDEEAKKILKSIADAQAEKEREAHQTELLALERENKYAYFGIGIAILNQRGDRQGATLLRSALMAVQLSDRLEDDQKRQMMMGTAALTMNYIAIVTVLFEGIQGPGDSPQQTMMSQITLLFQDVFTRLETVREQMHARFDRVDRKLDQISELISSNFENLNSNIDHLSDQMRSTLSAVDRLNDNVLTGFRIGEWKENEVWNDRCNDANLPKNFRACLSRALQKAGFLNLYSLSYDQLTLDLADPRATLRPDYPGLAYAGYFHDLVELDGYRALDAARNTQEYKRIASGTTLDPLVNAKLDWRNTPQPMLWLDSTDDAMHYMSRSPAGKPFPSQLAPRFKEALSRGVEIEGTLDQLAYERTEQGQVRLNSDMLRKLFARLQEDLQTLAPDVERSVMISSDYQIPLASNMKAFLEKNANWAPLGTFKSKFNSGAGDRMLTSCSESEPHFTNLGLHIDHEATAGGGDSRPNRKVAPGSPLDTAGLTLPEAEIRALGIPDIAWVAEIIGMGHMEFCISQLSMSTGQAARVYVDWSKIRGGGIIDVSRVQLTFDVSIKAYFIVQGEANNSIAARLFEKPDLSADNPLVLTLSEKTLSGERLINCSDQAGATEVADMIDGPMPAGSKKLNPGNAFNPQGDILNVNQLKALRKLWLPVSAPACQIGTNDESKRAELNKQFHDGILAQIVTSGTEEFATKKVEPSQFDALWRESVGYDTNNPYRSFAVLLSWVVGGEADRRKAALRASYSYRSALSSYNRLLIFLDLSLPARTEDAEAVLIASRQVTGPESWIQERIGSPEILRVPAGKLLDNRSSTEREGLEALTFSEPASTRGAETIRRRLLRLGYFRWEH